MKAGQLTIKVLEGRNLAPKDKTGKSDPYVVVKLIGIKKKIEKKKTKKVAQNLNPKWDESFTMTVTDIKIQALSITCWDWDRLSADDFMGQVTVTMKEIAQNGWKIDDWYTWDTNEKGEAVSGDVHLQLQLVPPAGQEGAFGPEEGEAEEEDDRDQKELDKQEDAFNAGKTVVTDVYEIGGELGRGAFATVKSCAHKATKRKYAVKIIDKKNLGDSNAISLEREIDIMQKVDHPNTIRLRQVFEDKANVYLVMELVTGGELFDKIVEKGCYTEKDAAILVRQMVDALSYLHDNGIAHRDLKPENLLLKSKTGTTLKIADFGLSRMIDETAMMKTACGTPTYVAPEVLQATGYGTEVDMWSIGVITYILLCGFPPFFGDTIPEMFEQIMSGSYDYPEEYWEHISKEAVDFINKLLVVDPKRRVSAKQALAHKWLTENAPDTDLSQTLRRRLQKTIVERKQEVEAQQMGGGEDDCAAKPLLEAVGECVCVCVRCGVSSATMNAHAHAER